MAKKSIKQAEAPMSVFVCVSQDPYDSTPFKNIIPPSSVKDVLDEDPSCVVYEYLRGKKVKGVNFLVETE